MTEMARWRTNGKRVVERRAAGSISQPAFDRLDMHTGNCRHLGFLHAELRVQSNYPLPELS